MFPIDVVYEIDRASLIPLYAQLAASIKKAIHSGAIACGDKLPSENDFMNLCGLSRMTVRSALSQLVTEKYIEKRHGSGAYVIYDAAAQVVSGTIDVLLDVTYTYFSTHYIKSISEVLTRNNYRFVIHDTRDSQQDICSILNRILLTGSTGVIIQPPHLVEALLPEMRDLLYRLGAAGIPHVLLDRMVEGVPGVQISFNEYAGGQAAAEYLVSLGHRNCAMVCASLFYENQHRLAGFNSVLSKHLFPPLHTVELDKHLRENLLTAIREKRITAVFCYNDEAALKAIRILADAGFRIPEDISVIGFDDTIITAATNPQLTSVIHPKDALGRMAAEKLISLIEGTPHSADYRVLDPKLHVRASCAPAREV